MTLKLYIKFFKISALLALSSISKACEFQDLPITFHTHVLSYLDEDDRKAVAKTCMHLYKIVNLETADKIYKPQHLDMTSAEFRSVFRDNSFVKKVVVERLNLTSKHIKNVGLSSNIVSLNFSINVIGRKTLKILCQNLQHNDKIRSLVLNNSPVSNRGSKYIARMISLNKSISHLNLSGNFIKSKGAKSIFKAIGQNSTLELFQFSNNWQKSKIYQVLFQNMINFNSIKSLVLNQSSQQKYCLDMTAITALSEYLKDGSALELLHLMGQHIDDEHVTVIGQALESNKVLQSLVLIENRIRDKGIIALCQSLMNNTTLNILRISGNRYGPQGDACLFNLCRSRPKLIIQL